MDNALERTIKGEQYVVRGYYKVPFEEVVKAIDEEDAIDIVDDRLQGNTEGTKYEYEEVLPYE